MDALLALIADKFGEGNDRRARERTGRVSGARRCARADAVIELLPEDLR